MLCDHSTRPDAASTAHNVPPKSGTYTTPACTVGVAETSPVVVSVHLGVSVPTFAGEIWCSLTEKWVSEGF